MKAGGLAMCVGVVSRACVSLLLSPYGPWLPLSLWPLSPPCPPAELGQGDPAADQAEAEEIPAACIQPPPGGRGEGGGYNLRISRV